MDELHEAQQLWLAEAVAFSVRRRVEKAAGVRAPDEPARLARGPEGSLAYCPDPEAHPTARLAEVVRALRPAAGPACPCAAARARTPPCPGAPAAAGTCSAPAAGAICGPR